MSATSGAAASIGAAAALVLVAAGIAPAAHAPVPVVLTQVPAEAAEPAATGGMRRGEWGDGGRVVLVRPSRPARVLSAGLHSAADPDVSFDGQRVVFAGRETASSPWCVYEREVRGEAAPRRVTCGVADAGARHPIYLSTVHTLTPTATEASDPIAFVGTNPGVTNEAGQGAHTSLYSCRPDGSVLTRLTFNLSSDFDPVLLEDGRIVYAAWQRHGLEPDATDRVALFGINLDGTDAMVFASAEGRRVKHMPAATRDGRLVFVEGERAAGDGAGSLAAVELRRSLHTYRPLTQPEDGLFHSPGAHPSGGVLVSWRPASVPGTYGAYLVDAATARRTLVVDDPRWHELQARAVAPRVKPDGRSSVVAPGQERGKLYGLDVSIHDLGDALPAGTARHVRVVEGRPRPSGGGRAPSRRLLGEAPLAADGSFHLEVPADTPLQIQLLDADGLALRTSAWLWARRNEPRGCIGCHEDPERTPPNRLAQALTRPAVVVAPTEAERTAVGFVEDVRPLIVGHCVSCHGVVGSPPRLDAGDVRAVYDALVPAYAHPGRARTSRLVWHLLGRNTARPWDGRWGGEGFAARPPLPAAAVSTFIRWIDLGAAWSAAAESGVDRASAGGDR